MFGIGKILGSVAGGLLDKIGLGKIAPFVKMGLNALTGNWLGVAKDVFSMVSNFKGNFLDKAAKKPPLGGFEQQRNSFAADNRKLNGNRIADLFKGFKNLFGGLKEVMNGNLGGLGKIFNAFQLLSESFNNTTMYNNRMSAAQFGSMQA